MRIISARRLWHSSITVPVYSLGVMMVAVSIGSSMWSMRLASGSSVGLSTSSSLPSVRKAVGHARSGGDQREVELALQALAHDLHVQEAEEPAAEADARAWEDSARR